eukprot:SAG31_NODE_1290_length_8981_cov_2.829543_1_plen_852_part_00
MREEVARRGRQKRLVDVDALFVSAKTDARAARLRSARGSRGEVHARHSSDVAGAVSVRTDLPRSKSPVDELMEMMDTDGDGTISKVEFRAAFLGEGVGTNDSSTGVSSGEHQLSGPKATSSREKEREQFLASTAQPPSANGAVGDAATYGWYGGVSNTMSDNATLDDEAEKIIAMAAGFMEAASSAGARAGERSPSKSPRHATWRRHITAALEPEPQTREPALGWIRKPMKELEQERENLTGKWIRIFYDDEDGNGEVGKVLRYDSVQQNHEVHFVSPSGLFRPAGPRFVNALALGEYVELPPRLTEQLEAQNDPGVPLGCFSGSATVVEDAQRSWPSFGAMGRSSVGRSATPPVGQPTDDPKPAVPPLRLDSGLLTARHQVAQTPPLASVQIADADDRPLMPEQKSTRAFSLSIAQRPDDFAKDLAARVAQPDREAVVSKSAMDAAQAEREPKHQSDVVAKSEARVRPTPEASATAVPPSSSPPTTTSQKPDAKQIAVTADGPFPAPAPFTIPTDAEDRAALELAGLRMSELMKKAAALGVEVGALADVQDAADPKAALIDMLLQRGMEGQRVVEELVTSQPSASPLGPLQDTSYMRAKTAAQAATLEAEISASRKDSVLASATAADRANRWPLHRAGDSKAAETGSSSGKTVSDLVRSRSGMVVCTTPGSPQAKLVLEKTVSNRADEAAAARLHNILHHSRPSLLVPTSSAHVYDTPTVPTLQHDRERRAQMRRSSSALQATISATSNVPGTPTRSSQLDTLRAGNSTPRSTLSLAGAPPRNLQLAPERILLGPEKQTTLRVGAKPTDPEQLRREISARIQQRKKGRVKYTVTSKTIAIERSLSLGKFL